jgi:hypothetical protein
MHEYGVGEGVRTGQSGRGCPQIALCRERRTPCLGRASHALYYGVCYRLSLHRSGRARPYGVYADAAAPLLDWAAGDVDVTSSMQLTEVQSVVALRSSPLSPCQTAPKELQFMFSGPLDAQDEPEQSSVR